MRLAVFVFSFIFLSAQTVAYAIPAVPALLVSLRGTGAILSKGKLLTGGQALTLAGGALYAYCKANKSTCKEIGGELVETLIPDDDSDTLDETCRIVTMYNLNRRAKQFSGEYGDAYDEHGWYRDDVAVMSQIQAEYNKLYDTPKRRQDYPLVNSERFPPQNNYSSVISSQQFKSDFESNCSRLEVGQYAVTAQFASGKRVAGADGFTEWYYSGHIAAYKTYEEEREEDDRQKEAIRKENEKKLLDLMKDKLDDDQITNIYNNYGDDIDNYCTGDNSCNDIDETYKEELEKNYKDYDITKCNIEGGKIVSCEKKVKKEEDEEGDTTNKVDIDVEKEGDDDDPHFCKTSDLTKEACEFFDWVDDEPEDPDDERVKVKDDDYSEKLKDDVIDVEKGCPPNLVVSYSVMGSTSKLEFDYKPLCTFAEKINPYLKAAGSLVAFYIVTGVRRDG